MAKILIVLLIALFFEATGIALLSKGLKQIGTVEQYTLPEIWRVVRNGLTSGTIWLGVLFEAIFFIGFLMLLSWGEMSVILPITAIGYVISTFVAKIYLHEEVPPMRWAGTCLIMLGVALVASSSSPPKKPDLRADPGSAVKDSGFTENPDNLK